MKCFLFGFEDVLMAILIVTWVSVLFVIIEQVPLRLGWEIWWNWKQC